VMESALRSRRLTSKELGHVIIITFEVAEVAWIGFQPLEGVFALVGAAVLALAAASRQQ